MTVLQQMVEQFSETNGKRPEAILVERKAAVALAVKGCLVSYCDGIPVEVQKEDLKVTDVVLLGKTGARRMGVFTLENDSQLAACGLR